MHIRAHILKLLEKLGLEEKAALFYLYVHQHPDCTVADVQAHYQWSRASTYRLFEALKENGFILHSSQNWRQKLRTCKLQFLAKNAGKQSLQLRKAQLELRKLAHLFALSPQWNSAPPVEIFTDQTEITEHCYRLLQADWSHINCFGSGEKAYDIPGESAMQYFVTQRARKGKTIKAIFTEMGQRTGELLRNNQRELRDGKLYLHPAYQDAMAYIYPKQVTVWQNDPQLGHRLLVIHDPYLIHHYQRTFDQLWSIS